MMTCDYGVEPDFVVHTQEEWSSISSNIALTRRRRCPIVVIDSPAIYTSSSTGSRHCMRCMWSVRPVCAVPSTSLSTQ